MRLKYYGRNSKKSKEYVQQQGLFPMAVPICKAKQVLIYDELETSKPLIEGYRSSTTT